LIIRGLYNDVKVVLIFPLTRGVIPLYKGLVIRGLYNGVKCLLIFPPHKVLIMRGL
jgi:hypothetical protein